MPQSDESFTRCYGKSVPVVDLVYDYLQRVGYFDRVERTPQQLRPSYDVRCQYSDDGDLHAWKHGVFGRIDVKGHQKPELVWTCADDFQHKLLLLSDVSKHDRLAARGPLIYMVVDFSRTHMAVVRGSTQDQWTQRYQSTPESGDVTLKYLAPMECVTFLSLEGDGSELHNRATFGTGGDGHR